MPEVGIQHIPDGNQIFSPHGIFSNAEDGVFRLVEQLLHIGVRRIIAVRHDTGAGIDELALHGLVADHVRVKITAGAKHSHTGKFGDVFNASGFLQLSGSAQLFSHGRRLDGSFFLIESAAGLENNGMTRKMKILRLHLGDNVVDLVLEVHHAGQHGLLSFLVVRGHPPHKVCGCPLADVV